MLSPLTMGRLDNSICYKMTGTAHAWGNTCAILLPPGVMLTINAGA